MVHGCNKNQPQLLKIITFLSPILTEGPAARFPGPRCGFCSYTIFSTITSGRADGIAQRPRNRTLLQQQSDSELCDLIPTVVAELKD